MCETYFASRQRFKLNLTFYCQWRTFSNFIYSEYMLQKTVIKSLVIVEISVEVAAP